MFQWVKDKLETSFWSLQYFSKDSISFCETHTSILVEESVPSILN